MRRVPGIFLWACVLLTTAPPVRAQIGSGGGASALPSGSSERTYSDGSLDVDFDAHVDQRVRAIVVQEDGKILIGGDFTWVGGVIRRHLARLNADGSPDVDFDPRLNDRAHAIAVQDDGRIVVGGDFTSVGGVDRRYVARLNADGSLDDGFNPEPNAALRSIFIQSDGKILLGGHFASLGDVLRSRIARLNPDGTLDGAFDPEANFAVRTIAVLDDGKILLGGDFTAVGNTGRRFLARLNADGSPDPDFVLFANGSVMSIAGHADGRMVVAGGFTTLGGMERGSVARVHPDGSLEADFDPGVNDRVLAMAVQGDGKILIAGWFTTVGSADPNNRRRHVARLNPDGGLDVDFDPDADLVVRAVALQGDGKVLIGGNFTTVGGVPRSHLARLDRRVELPDVATLDQNYPNPFRHETEIPFVLPESAPVRLELFDAIGRGVAVLVDDVQAAGSHRVRFDARDLPSGTYFYRLRAGDRVETRMLVVVR